LRRRQSAGCRARARGGRGGQRLHGAPPARDHRDRSADCRLDDAAHHHAPGDDRRSAVRAGEDDVRVARRGAGAAARRGAVGRRAAAAARAPHVDPARLGLGRPPDDVAAEELAEAGGAADRDSADAPVRRQRVAARPDRAARRQRAAGAARSGARDPQRRHRRRLQDSRAGADQRHDAIARRDHAVDRPGPGRAGDAAVRLHPAPRRSPRRAGADLPARDRIARRAARSGRDRPAAGSAAQGRVVGGARPPDAGPRPAAAGGGRMTAPRIQLADELLRRFAAALRSTQLYSKGHPIITRNLETLSGALQLLHSLQPSIVIGLVGDEVIVDDMPLAKADTLGGFVRRLQQSGVERITIDRGVTLEVISTFIDAGTTIDTRNADGADAANAFPAMTHIRVGRVTVEQKIEGSLTDMATIKRLYNDAVSAAGDVWESAQTEGRPDPTVSRTMIDGLAQAVAQNRRALLALTTLKNYDNYTFTHMVNVSILTMGQARGLGIDGPLLREFGLAALMHDIGKVKT